MLRPLPNGLRYRVDPDAPKYKDHAAVQELRRLMEPGDEIWFFDEPAPRGINAGALGYVLVRNGHEVKRCVTGIH